MSTADPIEQSGQSAAEENPSGAISVWCTVLRGIVSLIIVLAAGEVTTRLFIAGPSPQDYDPDIGYVYRPNSDQFQAKEGYTRFRFNSLGLNDDEVGASNGRCRVLVIGDSYTNALQVERAHNFTSVAERLDSRLDVVNAGRDGLFLGDLHKAWRRVAPSVHPELTVYVISQRAVEADIALSEFQVLVDPSTGEVVDTVMRAQDEEQLKDIFAPLLRQSALATRLAAQGKPIVTGAFEQFLKWRRALDAPKAQEAQAVPQAGAPAAAASAATAPGAGTAAGTQPSAQEYTRPSDEDVLTFMFRRLAAQGPTALLYLTALNYRSHQLAVIAPNSEKARLVAKRAAERAGVPFFDTAQELLSSVVNNRQPPYGFNNSERPGGHLNELGHEAVGAALVSLVHEMRPSLPQDCAAP